MNEVPTRPIGLLKAIMLPAMLASWVFGLWLATLLRRLDFLKRLHPTTLSTT